MQFEQLFLVLHAFINFKYLQSYSQSLISEYMQLFFYTPD